MSSEISWRGRRLGDYTQDELIEIFRELSASIESMQKNHATELASLVKMHRIEAKGLGIQPNWATICDSLRKEPEAWRATRYRLTHESGLSLWVANGFLFLKADSDSVSDVHLGIFGRWKVWRAYRKWKRWQLPILLKTKVDWNER